MTVGELCGAIKVMNRHQRLKRRSVFIFTSGTLSALSCTLLAATTLQASTLSGQITDALGRPLAGVQLLLKNADAEVVAHAVSATDGRFLITNMQPGKYALGADKPTFVHASQVLVISAEQASDISLTLASTEALNVKAKRIERARNSISVDTGSSIYRLSAQDIKNLPQGESTPINQVLLQAPGVAQDSYGQIHVRGDHGNLQYRLNGVILPESISGFGQTLDTHFVQSVSLLTGALPAQYGYRTAGVVDIQTRSGTFADGGRVGMMLGSRNTREYDGAISGSKNDLNYFLSGSLLGSDIGIENPTNASHALHDETRQAKGFAYFSLLIDDTSRASLILGATQNRFQIPNVPGQIQKFNLSGVSDYPSANLNEHQRENTRYGIFSYQSKVGDNFDYQVAAFTRFTNVFFTPDIIGDLVYNGVASTIARSSVASGLQADGSYKLSDRHTLRIGSFMSTEHLTNNSDLLAFPTAPLSNQPIAISDRNAKYASLQGVYVQDEWKVVDKLTVNYGLRLDHVSAYTSGSQLSPRLGAVYQWSADTLLHAGYARYFTPPPNELVGNNTIVASQGTTSAPPSSQNDPVKSESTNYYDVGISHRLTPYVTLGMDAYYKQVKHLLDEGQFGSALLFTPFNYAHGQIYGVEQTSNYRRDNVSGYLNIAVSKALGQQIESSQYNFSPEELDYIAGRKIHLDHDQHLTASTGFSYLWNTTTYSADAIYGSGLRRGFANTESLPTYSQMNMSVTQPFKVATLGKLEARLSVINLFDSVYQIRDGSGVGVGAPQFGPRRGIYVGLSKTF